MVRPWRRILLSIAALSFGGMSCDDSETGPAEACLSSTDVLEVVPAAGTGFRRDAKWWTDFTYVLLETPESSPLAEVNWALDASAAVVWHRLGVESLEVCHMNGTSGTIEVTGTLSDCTDTAQTGCLVGSLSFDWQDVVFEEGAWLDGVLTAVYDVGPDE